MSISFNPSSVAAAQHVVQTMSFSENMASFGSTVWGFVKPVFIAIGEFFASRTGIMLSLIFGGAVLVMAGASEWENNTPLSVCLVVAGFFATLAAGALLPKVIPLPGIFA